MLHRLAAKVDGWAAAHSGHPPERNPKVLVLLIVLAVSLAPTALGIQRMEGRPPISYSQQVAGACIVLGCLLCVFGLLWPRRRSDTGISIEIAGCIILGVGCLALAVVLGHDQLTPLRVALTLGLGIGCFARAVQIALYVRGRRLNSRFER